MKIIGIGYIPSSIKWIMDYIIESFGEEIMKDSIEIWGTKSDGYNIEFKLLSTGMIFEMSIEGKYFIMSATLLESSTPERKYILKKCYILACLCLIGIFWMSFGYIYFYS